MHRVESADDQNLPVCAHGCLLNPTSISGPVIQYDVMSSSWPADAVKSLKERVSLSNTLVASQNISTGALPSRRFRPIGDAPVSQRNTQAQGSGSGA
jgi:hypothetical protein